MRRGLTLFNTTSIAFGLAFLYLPIVILVIYSFNASRLVAVWGGWSMRWYAALIDDRAMLDAAAASFGIAAGSAAAAARVGPPAPPPPAPRARPLRRAHGVLGDDLRAAGDARGDHRAVAAPDVRRRRRRPRFPHRDGGAHHAHHVLRHRGGAVAARLARPQPGGGRDGPR